jgi:PEP-CTERM motif
MNPTLNRLLPVFVLCSVAAHAATISYTDSGTFTASTPATTFSGPGKTWAFSFQVDSSPTVSNVQLGIGFSPVFSNFSYTLNGSPVAVTPTSLSFFNAAFGGGFSFCFINTPSPCTALSLNNSVPPGPQMYTGLESEPTMLTGGFTLNTTFAVGSTLYTQPNTTVQAAAVPEPSTLLTLAAALFVLGWRRLYRRT